MNIKVRTNISSEFEDIEIVINSPEKNDLVQRIENSLIFETSKNIQKTGNVIPVLCRYSKAIDRQPSSHRHPYHSIFSDPQ